MSRSPAYNWAANPLLQSAAPRPYNRPSADHAFVRRKRPIRFIADPNGVHVGCQQDHGVFLPPILHANDVSDAVSQDLVETIRPHFLLDHVRYALFMQAFARLPHQPLRELHGACRAQFVLSLQQVVHDSSPHAGNRFREKRRSTSRAKATNVLCKRGK